MPVTARLDPQRAEVDPGGSVTFVLRLANDGPGAATVRPEVDAGGGLGRFAWVSASPVEVGAGGAAEVRLGFRPPRTAAVPAGTVGFRVSDGPGGPLLAAGEVEVKGFTALSLSLDPPEASSAGGGQRVTVATRGNAAVDAGLEVEAGAGVEARADPPSVRVAPDAPASATISVAPARRPLSGRPGRIEFAVRATAPGGEAVEARGSVSVRPVVPARTAVLAAVVVALVAGVAGVRLAWPQNSPPRPAEEVATPAPVDPRARCPAEFHHDPIGIRSLTPDDIKRLPDDYAFLRVKEDRCTPMRFNPCQPVGFVQNAAAAPPGAAEDVREAFRRLGAATGINFVDEGLTDETTRTEPYVPERYGRRWAPVLVVWESFGAERTEGEVQFLGNTVVMRVEETVVSGRLRLNVDAYNDEAARTPIPTGFGPPGPATGEPIGRINISWGRIVLHELAHLVGLGHNRNPGSLMYPDAAQHTIRPVGFSEGDLTGLRLLGREAGCLRTPPLPT